MLAYLAASYQRKAEIAAAAAYLESKGIEVVSDWHKEIYKPNVDIRTLPGGINQALAQKDMSQLAICDTFIFFAEDQNHQPPRGGRHVEFGVAMALGKRIIVIGEQENIFHHLPSVEVVQFLDEVA